MATLGITRQALLLTLFLSSHHPLSIVCASRCRDSKGKFDKNSDRVHFQALLTIDGGGIRGIIAVKVLETIEKAIRDIEMKSYRRHAENPPDIYLADYFRCFSGINSGAWIAAYLASNCGNFSCSEVFKTRPVVDKYGTVKPGTVRGLKVLFELFSSKIYPQSPYQAILKRSTSLKTRKCLVGICPIYPVKGYRQVMADFLGQTVIRNLPASLILPMYDLKKRSVVAIAHDNIEPDASRSVFTYIFQEMSRPTDPLAIEQGLSGFAEYTNRSYSLLDVTLAAGTTAMEQRPHRFHAMNEHSFELVCTDAAYLNSNPTLMALAIMGRLKAKNGKSSDRTMISDVSILSIGTGMVDGSLEKQADSGILQWSILSDDFMSVVVHGGSELIQNQVDSFTYGAVGRDNVLHPYFAGQYLRVQAQASTGTPFGQAIMASEDMKYFELLKQIGDDTVENFKYLIEDFIRVYVCEVEDRTPRQLTAHLIDDGWEKMSSMVEHLQPPRYGQWW